MAGRQRIDRVRREYNQWVANQTLEDFALRFTAKRARQWSAAKVGNTALGAVSFLALEAIGGTITLNYGFINAGVAIIVVGIVIFATALPICFYAANYGVDIDLLTRGAGFGYIGSTITSLIYASFTFLFFAIESVILAMALELCLGVPLTVGYLISALAVIPLVTYGISAISRFQVWTQPLFVLLNIAPVLAIVTREPQALVEWQSYAGPAGDGFRLLSCGAAASVAVALIVQVGEQVDYLRFLPERREKPRAWWLALVSAGPGWVIVGMLKLLLGSFLAVYLIHHGFVGDVAADPPRMYAVAFERLVGSRPVALGLTCLLVVVCQLKINVTNAYAGSIAWSNFFSRLTHSHPGRVVWLVFNVAVALLVMELGVYRALEQTLAFYSSVAVAWVRSTRRRSRDQQAAGAQPTGHRVQARTPLRHQSRGNWRDDARHRGRDAGPARRLRADSEIHGAFSGPRRRARKRAADRLDHTRPLLPRADAGERLDRPGDRHLLHLRKRLRAGRYGVVPRLRGPDLLAMLLTRRALS